jgi:hypothetical protein
MGYQEGTGSFLSAGYRFALHDFLDPEVDYPKDTDLQLLDLKVRLPLQKPQFWLDDLTLIRVGSLPPMESLSSERSWELELGARTDRDGLCDHCVAGHLRGGLGGTWKPAPTFPIEGFLLADFDLSYGPGYTGFPVKPGFGPHAGIRFHCSQTLLALAQASYFYTISAANPDIYQYGLEARWSPVLDFALNARVQRYLDGWEGAGGLLYYF